MSGILVRVVILSAALALADAARAQNAAFADPGDAAPGTHGVLYLDLLRQIVPDIALTNGVYEGHKVIGMRHIGGADMSSEPPETVDALRLSVLPVRSDAEDRLLLLASLGYAESSTEDFTVLGLYTVGDSPRLIDVVDVGYDRFTGFNEPAKLSLGEGKDLVITQSSHFNSNQNYEATLMMLLRNDRLQLVDIVWTFDDRSCSYERDEVPEFRAGERDGRTYSDIVATVVETTALNNAECGDEQPPKPGTRTFTVTYRWDESASKFVADSEAWDRLAKENQERY
jgi:hypothetical protein